MLRRSCVFASYGICGSRSAFRCIRGTKRLCTIFHAQVGPIQILQKVRRDTLHQTLVFPSIMICGSRGAFRCIRGTKWRHTIFHARVGPVQIWQKHIETSYAKHVFLHPVGSASHVVHSDASWAWNGNTLFFIIGWDQYGFGKKCVGTSYVEHMFLYLVESAGHVVHSGASGHKMATHYFSCSGGIGTVLTKSKMGHVMPNLCFASYGICGSRSAFCCIQGRETLTHYFSCSGGIDTNLIKNASRHITTNLFFCIRWDLWAT
jgi:hypothetical protein